MPILFINYRFDSTDPNHCKELGKLDPEHAKAFRKNARRYAKTLRQIRADALSQLTQIPGNQLRVATIHGAYDYMLREFGIEVTAVVEPAHGVEPSPSQLAKTIDMIRNLDVDIIFSELNFPSPYVDTIRQETGVQLYPLSHIIYGAYYPEKFEKRWPKISKPSCKRLKQCLRRTHQWLTKRLRRRHECPSKTG